jgi:saccharopine dehydrogenase-like NADP-dependent oxidoreductase
LQGLNKKVCVIGLGNVGLPTAPHINNHGFSTYGYDIDEQKLRKISQFSVLSKWSQVPKGQIYVICVFAGLKDGKPDTSNLFDVCNKIVNLQEKVGDEVPLACVARANP